jgi:hypothetical protein
MRRPENGKGACAHVYAFVMPGILIAYLFSTVIGCGDDAPAISEAGISNFRYDSTAASGTVGCCNERIYFSFDQGSAGQRYYYIGIEKDGRLLAYGPDTVIDGAFFDVEHYIDINYTHNLTTGEYYNFYVYACNYESDVGVIDDYTGRAGPENRWFMSDWSGEPCFPTCCTPGYYYATAFKDSVSAIGARAKIKSRYGDLCRGGQGSLTSYAHSCVYVNINDANGSWVQSGFIKRRDSLTIGWNIGRYSEASAGDFFIRIIDSIYHGSFEGAERTYQIELVVDSGLWQISDNGEVWGEYEDAYWIGMSGVNVQWTGEIFGYETDMAGTSDNPCTIENCAYKVVGHTYYQDADLTPSDMRSSDFGQWQTRYISGTEAEIWDANPL